jgi:hypothetical protein
MTIPATSPQRAFDPSHADFSAFAGIADSPRVAGSDFSVAPRPKIIFPPKAKLAVGVIVGVGVLLSVLLVVAFGAAALPGILTIVFFVLGGLFIVAFLVQMRAGLSGTPLLPGTSVVGAPGDAAKHAVLTRFAEDNGLLYRPRSPGPAYPGRIFLSMFTRLPYVYDHLSAISGRYLDFGNFHSYSETGDGPGGHLDPDPAMNSWGFVALQMDQQLPNILLISKHRIGGSTTLPMPPDPSQILSLEGNFGDHFTLYCPKEFEQDALYILTPDLMALLIDDAAPFDVEIVDRWMFLYVARPFNSMDPAVYRRIFQILENVGTTIVGQTSHFSSPELASMPALVPPPTPGWHFVPNPELFGNAGPPGTRLKPKRQLVGMLVVIGLFVLVIVAVIIYGTVSGTGHFG